MFFYSHFLVIEDDGGKTPSHDEQPPSSMNQPLPGFIPGFPPPGMFGPPPSGILPPGMPPPGFQGGRLPFPPPHHGMVPADILQLNLQQQRPPLQGIVGIPPQQQQQGLSLQGIPQQQFGGQRPPMQLNNFHEQLIRPGVGPGQQPQFPGQQPQRPPPQQTGFVPGFSAVGGGPPPNSFSERPPLSPNGDGRPNQNQGGFGERAPLNPLNELLIQRPGLQNLINRNRMQQQQNNENRFGNQQPQQDTRLISSSQQRPTAPGAPPRPPWLQNRDNNIAQQQNNNEHSNNEDDNVKWDNNNKNPANIPTASFLLNLVNQHKEQAAAAASEAACHEVDAEERGGERQQRSPAREDRDSRDNRRRSRSRERDRGGRRDRRDRDRSRDRNRRDRDRSGDRDRSSRRDRSGDRRSGRDRDRNDRRGGSGRDEERRRNSSRDRGTNFGRDRSRDRESRKDDRRRSRDRSQDESSSKEEISTSNDRTTNDKDDRNDAGERIGDRDATNENDKLSAPTTFGSDKEIVTPGNNLPYLIYLKWKCQGF